MQLNKVLSRRVILAVRRGSDRRKVFQVMFLRDGSIIANFPYFRDSSGLLSAPSLPAGSPLIENFTVGKGDGSKCTSHKVKYTHHLDGEAHFSQDGKILTSIRRKAVPLRQAGGHLFTLRVQGLDDFEQLHGKTSIDTKRSTIVFADSSPLLDSYQFTGWIHSIPDLLARTRGQASTTGPILRIVHPQRGILPAVALGNPHDSNDTTVLIVSLDKPGQLFTDGSAGLLFMGGFDPPTIVNNYTIPTGFLALRCPVNNLELAKSEIGTVDLA